LPITSNGDLVDDLGIPVTLPGMMLERPASAAIDLA